jgi:hypothetical protein
MGELQLSQPLSRLQNSRQRADTWNFVFETAPSPDNCIVGPDYPAEANF